MKAVTDWSASIQRWVDRVGAKTLGLILGLIIAVAVLVALLLWDQPTDTDDEVQHQRGPDAPTPSDLRRR